MAFILFVLSSSVILIGLAILSNRLRAAQVFHFELKPNCLLTRWPILFITGPRTLFYFSSYWNIYSPFLAEHGYETFTLHLPWAQLEARKKRFLEFLEIQEKAGKRFHLFMDPATLHDLDNLLRDRSYNCLASLTEIGDAPTLSLTRQGLQPFPLVTGTIDCQLAKSIPPSLKITYYLHRLFIRRHDIISLSALGACDETALHNAALVLSRAQTLGEMDLRESR